MAQSYEAIATVRKRGSIGTFSSKWLTVLSPNISEAIRAFNAMGYEVNSCRVVKQEEATRIAQIIGNQ